MFAVLAVLLAGYLFGYLIGTTGQLEVKSDLNYNFTSYNELLISDTLIIREVKTITYSPVERRWIPRDNVPGADSKLADRVMLIFFDSAETRYDTVRYSTK